MLFTNEDDYDRIVRIGQSILTLHQEKDWKHKTRSNYAYYRIESVYYAMEELEMVLVSWKRIAENNSKDYHDLSITNTVGKQKYCKLKKAKKNYNQIFKQSDIVPHCINSLINMKSLLRKHFTESLMQAFPRHIPVEVNV
jgi:hypothetical protein